MLSHSPKIVTDGLVLCLDAANGRSYPGTGTTWYDLSGQANDGTLTNGPTYSSDNLGNFSFDGVNDYVLVNAINNTSNITIIGCARFTDLSYPTYTGLVSKDTSTGRIYQLNLYQGRLQSHLNAVMTTDETVGFNTWFHYCLTSESGVGSYLYLNGVQKKFTANVIPSNTANIPTTIHAYNNYFANGKSDISQTLIYNKALSPDEIKQNFNATRGRFGL